MLTASEIRAARYLLGWGPSKLAAVSGLRFSVIERAERGTLDQAVSEALQRVFEQAGIEFNPTSPGGNGVRLKKVP